MAELTPDKILADLQAKLDATRNPAQRAAIQDQINARQVALTGEYGGNVGFGAAGMFIPKNAAPGTTILQPTYEQGVYTKTTITGDTSRDPYGRSSISDGNKITLYDSSGKPLTAAQAAKTETALNFAAAGWDIGFGPGFIAPGVKPDIEFATFNSGRANMADAAAAAGLGGGGGSWGGSGTTGDPLTFNGSPYNGVRGGVSYNNGVAQSSTSNASTASATDAETKARRTAQQDFKAALGELGLADLADEVDRMIKEDYTVSQIKLELPKSASYQLRFPGMKALRDAGRAISEATYISNERGYQQTLRAYGLDTAVFGSRSEMGKYIALEVSPREFEERVNLASTRVKDNPDVMNTFKSYFPEVDESGVISYLLNPTKGMDIIKKQLRTTEIGAAATKAGFANQVNAAYAGTLIGAVGESTYAQISNEFQRARQLANSQRRLAEIEGQAYSDLEAVSAVVGDDVTSALASERRAAREVARFGTRGGISGTSLGTTAQI